MEEGKGTVAGMCNKWSFNTYTQDGSMKTENKCFSRDFPELLRLFRSLDFTAFLTRLSSLYHIRIKIQSGQQRETRREQICEKGQKSLKHALLKIE